MGSADPPWYIEHYYAFLKASSKLLAKEGKLLLSVLPRLTRPSAPRDRLNIIEQAAKYGFDLIEVRPAALHYASPPFEIEALRAEDLALDDWRAGDIFCFTLRCHPLQGPDPHKPTDEDNWRVFQLGATIVKIKDEQRLKSQAFDYRPVSPTGSVRLRSVSRRSPVRSKINLWTSRNIALAVSKPIALSEALEKLRDGHPLNRTLASTACEYQLNNDEVNKLQEVLELLSKDAGLMERVDILGNNWKHALIDRLSLLCRNTPLAQALENESAVGVHLGVFVEPYLTFLLQGKKTIESRFSINKHAPFEQVQDGDILVLKKSSGPVCANCRVAHVWSTTGPQHVV